MSRQRVEPQDAAAAPALPGRALPQYGVERALVTGAGVGRAVGAPARWANHRQAPLGEAAVGAARSERRALRALGGMRMAVAQGHAWGRPVRWFASVLLAAAVLPACRAGTLLQESFDSTLLGRRIDYSAYLSAAGTPPRRVLYLLHGSGGDARSWLRADALAPALTRALEAAAGDPFAVVMPSLGPASWWIDGAAEAAASALMRELLPHAEARLRLQPGGAPRAVAGVSMGGFGALSLVLDHPGAFCAAALLSPAVYDPLPPVDSAARRSPQFAAQSGGFDEAAWRRMTPLSRLPAYAAQAHRVPMWIVSGDHDELGIALHAARLYEQLRALQPERVELRIIDGGHDGATFDAALAGALAYLGARCR